MKAQADIEKNGQRGNVADIGKNGQRGNVQMHPINQSKTLNHTPAPYISITLLTHDIQSHGAHIIRTPYIGGHTTYTLNVIDVKRR